MRRKIGLYGGVALWAVLFAMSFALPAQIDGARSLETGLQRLDIWARYQAGAFAVALICAGLGGAWRKTGRRYVLLAISPLLVTLTLALGLAAVIWIRAPQAQPAAPALPPGLAPKPTQD